MRVLKRIKLKIKFSFNYDYKNEKFTSNEMKQASSILLKIGIEFRREENIIRDK